MKKSNNKNDIKTILLNILPVISILLLLLGWLKISADRPDLMPGPIETWERLLLFIEKPIGGIPLSRHVLDSLRRVGIAVTLSTITGIVFGILMGWSKFFNASFGMLFEIVRFIPPLAWIPLITIWFGIGEFPKILIVYIGTFSTVALNSYAGVRMVDPLYLSVGEVFQASNSQILREIIFPSSLPAIFAGIRTAVGAGWAIVLAAEMLGARTGTGFLITRGNAVGDMALIIICMFIIGIIGALLSVATSYIERKVTPWVIRTR